MNYLQAMQNKQQEISSLRSRSHSYVITRLRVKKTFLLRKNDYERLLNMSFAEFLLFLRNNSQYSNEIKFFERYFSGFQLVDYSLNRNLENTFSMIMHYSPKHTQLLLSLFLEKYDIYNIVSIIRALNASIDKETLKLNIIAAGSLQRPYLEYLIDKSKDVETFVGLLDRKNPYYKIVKKNYKNPELLEDRLIEKYLQRLYNSNIDSFRSFALDYAKIINTRQKLRNKKKKLKITKDTLEIPETVKDAEAYMQRWLIEKRIKKIFMYKATIDVIVAYLLAKETEAKNLRLITSSKTLGLDEQTIKDSLVYFH